jgi:hypothetical protein
MTKGKPRKAPLWRLGNRATVISSGTVNKYLAGHGWKGSAKTFRTVRGDKIFARELEDEPTRFNTRDNAIKYVQDKIKKVGNELGHRRKNKATGKWEDTFATASQSYIDPTLILEFFHRHNVHPLPPWAARLEHVDDAADNNNNEE